MTRTWRGHVSCLRTLLLFLVLGWMMPGTSSAAPPEIPTPRSFAKWYIDGDHGTTVIVGVVLREIGGNLAVCGAGWREDGRFDTTATDERFQQGVIKVEGRVISVNLGVFLFPVTREEVTTFRCSVSDRPWKDRYKNADFTWKAP